MHTNPQTLNALETTFNVERPRLVAFCARRVGDWQLAEDLAQETLYEAWRSAGRLREMGSLRAWLFGIARNVCRRWYRRHAREAVAAGVLSLLLLPARQGRPR